MKSKDWYIRNSEYDGDNYLSHRECDIKIKFVDPLEGETHHGGWINTNLRVSKYKNTTDLIFIKDECKKMFGINLGISELEELIRSIEICLKKIKMNSF